MEGNSNYLVEMGHPHLFNLEKLRLVTKTLHLLVCLYYLSMCVQSPFSLCLWIQHKLQRGWYNFAPIRCVAAVLNLAAKSHWKYSTASSTAFSAMLFQLSEEVEPDNVILQHANRAVDAIRRDLFAIPTNDLHQAEVSSAVEVEEPKKYQRSDAYDRIRRGSVAPGSSGKASLRKKSSRLFSFSAKQSSVKGQRRLSNTGDSLSSAGNEQSDANENDSVDGDARGGEQDKDEESEAEEEEDDDDDEDDDNAKRRSASSRFGMNFRARSSSLRSMFSFYK